MTKPVEELEKRELWRICRIDNCIVKFWKVFDGDGYDEKYMIVRIGHGFTHKKIADFVNKYLVANLGSAMFTLFSSSKKLLNAKFNNDLKNILEQNILEQLKAISDSEKETVAKTLTRIIKNKFENELESCDENGNYKPPIIVTYDRNENINAGFVVELEELEYDDLRLLHSWFPYDLDMLLNQINKDLLFISSDICECKYCKIDEHDELAICDIHKEHKSIDLLIKKKQQDD